MSQTAVSERRGRSRGDGARVAVTTTEGTAWSWERLYADFATPISSYARSKGVPAPDDLAQDVLRVAVERLDSFVGDDAGLRSWLFTIAHRRVADHHRRSYRRPEMLVADHRPLAATGTGPEDRVMSRAEVSDIFGAFSVVSERERTVLQMRIIDEVSPNEVATAMGISSGNVRVIQARALNKIRAHLARVNGASSASVLVIGVASVIRFVRDMSTSLPTDEVAGEWIGGVQTAVRQSGAVTSTGAATAASGAVATSTATTLPVAAGSTLVAAAAGKLVVGAGLVAAAAMVGPAGTDLVTGNDRPTPTTEITDTLDLDARAPILVVPSAPATDEPVIDPFPQGTRDFVPDTENTRDAVNGALDPVNGALGADLEVGALEDLSVGDTLDDVAGTLPLTQLTGGVDDLVDDVRAAIELPPGLDPIVDDVLDEVELTPVVEDVLDDVGEVGDSVDEIVGSVVHDDPLAPVDDLTDGLGDLLSGGSGWPWASGN